MDDIRLWASYRGQTLARTGIMISYPSLSYKICVFSAYLILSILLCIVRGMMYCRRALELQCYEDMINDEG